MTPTRKLILFLALALIVFLYAVANNLGKNEPTVSQPRTLIPIDSNSRYEIPISDSPMDYTVALTSDVNNWPIYRNEQFGFSLKYPPGWGVTNEKFEGNTWFIGFAESEHDFNFGLSITRDSLEDKINLEKGNDFWRLEKGPEVDSVKIVKIIFPPNEYYKENIITYVFAHRGYSFGLRGDPWLLHLALPTLHFF